MRAKEGLAMRVSALGLLTLFAAGGCGRLTDPDHIVVAKVGDRLVRRADLNEVLRNMMPEERPLIRTRGDLLRVLENHVDRLVKHKLAEDLQGQGKIRMPRELAAQQFDARFPSYRASLENADQMGLSNADKAFLEQERDLRIDRLQKDLLGEAAIYYRIREALEAGNLTITEQEFEEEFSYRKEELRHYEELVFEGICVPASQQGASTLATEVYNRMKAGEDVSALAAECETAGTGFPLNSGLPNDPGMAHKFGPFWEQASGAPPGAVIGPVFISGWEAARPAPDGQIESQRIPDAFLVCKVIQAVPERPKTLEEAKPELSVGIFYAKMIRKLREENGVEVYEDNLPDPAAYDSSAPRSVLDMGS